MLTLYNYRGGVILIFFIYFCAVFGKFDKYKDVNYCG